MGELRVISSRGDRIATWDPKKAETGDTEAQEAVREAERIFKDQLRRGATAFRTSPDTEAKRLEWFDPEAQQIVVVPRLVGG